VCGGPSSYMYSIGLRLLATAIRVAVSREVAAASDAEEVDDVVLRDAEEERVEGDGWFLGDAEVFDLVGERGLVEGIGGDEGCGYIWEGRSLVGDY
jgi:hypothetical protein